MHSSVRQRGVDYKPFRDLLAAGEWEKADDEHRRLMCVLGGEDAEDRGWVYFTEARDFPVADLKTIDALWVHFSEGRHGFSVQRKLWVGAKRQWPKFFKQIDWVQGENDNYRKWPEEARSAKSHFLFTPEAARGHMPLTNALRGTTLLESLLEHPAFAPPKKPQEELASQLEEAGDKLQSAMANLPGLKGLKKPSWMK
ncbi:uncharacterized protein MICPUCDRAFT_23339 [Micromonas pusilla CCMP1545]|uniref:Predicted protein n=1 Tax=Micromonas pusilla (strain CCMP1545) TaxID=564608 RepID=C1N7L3_MICPC|nr:uncharacterized protein MICPUCDRAFT_23339 [Micromonas pusilla CCMP1545]EEH51739.1 predicted protein [Micromonas pusilla CCMP1545]|eukprot:XP_003064117.1 predicted protein [Micromonas pusilla CCMP1545]